MRNKLLLTSILALACWANAFAQLCTYTASATLSGNDVKNCTRITISGAGVVITLQNDWSPANLTSLIVSGGAILHFNNKTITLPASATLFLTSGGTISSGGASARLEFGGVKTYTSTQFGIINSGGGADQTSVLPLELLSFNGATGATGNLLHWKTGIETNVSHFDIERSTNGQTFTKISQAKVKGSNSEYGFLDANPAHNTYYRLKINDMDGSFDYSNVISVQTNGTRTVQIYPTITQDAVTIATESTENIAQVTVFDMFGKAVLVANTLENNRLDLSALPTGMYLVQWQLGGEVQSAKIVKK
jgi:Secretion system C-terminal sorting domain